MDEQIRWGLLSTARINRRLIPAIRASNRSRLTAVASRNESTAVAYAKEWDIPITFGSYEAMLASDTVDVVYISLPNHLHAEWAIRAMNAGKHVLCEKPFALSVTEVDRMIQTSLSTGCVLAEAFMYRHHPQTKAVLEWVNEGRLGKVQNFFGTFSFKHAGGNDYRLNPLQGGGSLWDVGVYPISFAQAVFGVAPKRVIGVSRPGPSGIDLTFAGLLEYDGGCSAQILSSFDQPFNTQVVISGDQGRIDVPRPFLGIETTGYFMFDKGEDRPERVEYPMKDLYLGEVEDLESAVLDGQATEVSLIQSRDHVRTVEALLLSAKSRKPVDLT